GALAIGRIALDDFIEAGAVLGGIDKRRAFVFEQSRRLVEGGVVGHLGMKAHRTPFPIDLIGRRPPSRRQSRQSPQSRRRSVPRPSYAPTPGRPAAPVRAT